MDKTCTVVVADDNHDAADSLALLVESLGYRARAVYDGREAVAACADCLPVAAILDVQMPALDGCAAARLIRMGPRPPLLIASHTALAHDEEPMKSGRGAFDVHLAKPARLEDVRRMLAMALGDGPG